MKLNGRKTRVRLAREMTDFDRCLLWVFKIIARKCSPFWTQWYHDNAALNMKHFRTKDAEGIRTSDAEGIRASEQAKSQRQSLHQKSQSNL